MAVLEHAAEITENQERALVQVHDRIALVSRFRRPKERFVLVSVIALVCFGVFLLVRSRAGTTQVFETSPLESGSIQASITATGTLNPVIDVQVGSQVSGNIKALYADFNTKVKKGQLVALIDPQIFQAQVDQVTGALGSAHSAVIAAKAQLEKARADLAGAQAAEKNSESIAAKDKANSIYAEAQWRRIHNLFAQGVMSQDNDDSAYATYTAAQAQLASDAAQVDAAKHSIQSGQAQVELATSQIEAAEAQERQAQAALNQARINLDHTRIVAPVDGTVIARRMDVGQTVAASFQSPTIFEIAQDLTKMQVDANVDESDVGGVRVGQRATFTVDAYAGTAFQGSVTDIRKAPITAQNVVTYDVVIGVANPDLRLFPGMTANVTILTLFESNVLKIPNAALRFRLAGEATAQVAGRKQTIYVLSNGMPKPIAVNLGISDGKFTAVSGEGLHSGEAIIVRTATKSPSNTTQQPSSPGRRLGF